MDQDTVKSQLLRDKEFLRSLYQVDDFRQSKQTIIFASDAELSTLIKFLHLVTIGEIKIRKRDFEAIVHAR